MKKYPLRWRLNSFKLSISRIFTGSEFQSRGPATTKARSPSVLSVFLGTFKINLSDPRRLCLYCLTDIKLLRYVVARPCKALKTITHILKSMRFLTGSQCRLQSVGVMWQNLGSLSITRAAVFCTRWTLSSCLAGKPNKRLLQ